MSSESDSRYDNFEDALHIVSNDVETKIKNYLQDKSYGSEIEDISIIPIIIKFDKQMETIIFNHGLDIFEPSITEIDQWGLFKAIIYLEAKAGHVFYIHAKQFVNKDKLSFLAPLIVNSAKLSLYNNLNENPSGNFI